MTRQPESPPNSSNRTIVIECGHWCEYDPLYAGPANELLVGLVCDECCRQYFFFDAEDSK